MRCQMRALLKIASNEFEMRSPVTGGDVSDLKSHLSCIKPRFFELHGELSPSSLQLCSKSKRECQLRCPNVVQEQRQGAQVQHQRRQCPLFGWPPIFQQGRMAWSMDGIRNVLMACGVSCGSSSEEIGELKKLIQNYMKEESVREPQVRPQVSTPCRRLLGTQGLEIGAIHLLNRAAARPRV